MKDILRSPQQLRTSSNPLWRENKTSKTIKVTLIDGSELVRRGLWQMLESSEEGVMVVGDYASVEEALFEMTKVHSDVVLIGTQLPGMSWLEATRSLKRTKAYSDIEVVILAESAGYRNEALEAGAADYILKDVTSVELMQVIRRIYRDKSSVKEREGLAEEVVELVIPPPANNSQLLRFMCQLAEILRDGFASIICTVGSWDGGTVITIRPYSTTQSTLVLALAHMAEVEKVEEESVVAGIFPRLYHKIRFMSNLGINPGVRLRVTLKESAMVGREVALVLN